MRRGEYEGVGAFWWVPAPTLVTFEEIGGLNFVLKSGVKAALSLGLCLIYDLRRGVKWYVKKIPLTCHLTHMFRKNN